MDWKGVMGWSVMEQRCDRVEGGVLGQMSAEARLIKRKMRISKWAKLIFRLGSNYGVGKPFILKGMDIYRVVNKG